MGVCTSKDTKNVMNCIQQQDKKINDLIHRNQVLQQKLTDLQAKSHSEGKNSIETNDLTNMLDVRFNKLEKTMEKMHSQFKSKLFEGVTDNLDKDLENGKKDSSLTLDFAKETVPKKYTAANTQWKDLLDDSEEQVNPVTIERKPSRGPPGNSNSNKKKNFFKQIQGNSGIISHNQIQIETGIQV